MPGLTLISFVPSRDVLLQDGQGGGGGEDNDEDTIRCVHTIKDIDGKHPPTLHIITMMTLH